MYLIVGNWKMNPTTLKEAKLLFNSVKRGVKNIKNVEVIICPPSIYLLSLIKQGQGISHGNIRFGAQNCFWEEKGAFTGEISPLMFKNLGLEYVILGHSERRKYFGETNEMINRKIKAVFKTKLKPILCIGEEEKERRVGKTNFVLKNQLQKTLLGLSAYQLKDLIIAYEPVWAIGTGFSCAVKEAKEVLQFLRKEFKKNYLLYGGSVNSENARDYIEKAGFDGLLVGGASLEAEEFVKIAKNIKSK